MCILFQPEVCVYTQTDKVKVEKFTCVANVDTRLKNCGMPYPKDITDDIELNYLETYLPNGLYGAPGCGESPLDAPCPVLNAIFNATGACITRVPALSEVVQAVLEDLKK